MDGTTPFLLIGLMKFKFMVPVTSSAFVY